MSSDSSIRGGCLCGETRYLLAKAPTDLNDCYCVDCRRSSGAPFVSWGSVSREDCRILSGTVRVVHHAHRRRGFAACCGTQLFFEQSAQDPVIDVTLGSLDDPAPFAPTIAIWTEDRLPWAPLQPGRPAHLKSSDES